MNERKSFKLNEQRTEQNEVKTAIGFVQLNNQIPINNYDEKENRSGGWYNWGEDNLFPNYLLELYNKSAKHSSLVQTKAQMIGGNGVNTSQLPDEVKIFLRNRYNKECVDEIIAKCSYDLEIYNGFALNIIWSNDRKSIAKINYADPFNLRIAIEEENDVCENYYKSKDWTRTRKYKPEFIQGFTTEKKDKLGNPISPNQILFVKSYVPTQLHYPQPKYLSGANWIEIDYEISVWHLSGIKKEFSPRTAITFTNGIPPKDKIDSEIKRIRTEYEGAAESGKTMFFFATDKEHAPIFEKLDGTISDQRYLLLNKDAQEGIFVAHQVVSPALHGIRIEGQLGTTKELIDALKVFQSQYIDARQKIIEDTFKKLAGINGITSKIELNKYSLPDSKVELLPMSSNDLLAILESSLTEEQKYNMLIQLGYSDEAAKNLTKNNTQ